MLTHDERVAAEIAQGFLNQVHRQGREEGDVVNALLTCLATIVGQTDDLGMPTRMLEGVTMLVERIAERNAAIVFLLRAEVDGGPH